MVENIKKQLDWQKELNPVWSRHWLYFREGYINKEYPISANREGKSGKTKQVFETWRFEEDKTAEHNDMALKIDGVLQ